MEGKRSPDFFVAFQFVYGRFCVVFADLVSGVGFVENCCFGYFCCFPFFLFWGEI